MVIQKDGKTYWKHDRISVDKKQVILWYRDTPILYLDHTAVFEMGDTLNIIDIEVITGVRNSMSEDWIITLTCIVIIATAVIGHWGGKK
jgi:hypothetical protein